MPTPKQIKQLETLYSFAPIPIFDVAFKALELFGYFDQADPLARSVQILQAEIEKIKQRLDHINERLNQLAQRVAQIENRNRIQRLSDLNRQVAELAFQLSLAPVQVNERALIAFKAGNLADVFLDEPDLWRWSDLETVFNLDDDGNQVGPPEIRLLPESDFIVIAAQGIYVFAILTWIAAIEVDTGGNTAVVEKKYGDRLRRHHEQNSIRDGWDEVRDPPETLPEKVRAKIICRPIAQHKFALDRTCTFAIECENIMRGTTTWVHDVVVTMPDGPDVLCTARPEMGKEEGREIADQEGVAVFTRLADLIQRVLRTGTLRQQFIGWFGARPTKGIAWVYTIAHSGELSWYMQKPLADLVHVNPDAIAAWEGPKVVRTGWDSFTSVFPAGGARFYGLMPDGTLQWWRHDGFNDGRDEWTGPITVGRGWDQFQSIVPGSDGVLYAILPDGDLLWHRDPGYRDGGDVNTWIGPRRVWTSLLEPHAGPLGDLPASHWPSLKSVFSIGQGILYGVDNDGNLLWHRHKGFADGSIDWEGPVVVGHGGWQEFREIFGVSEGVIYAVKPDGTILWYRHDGWKTGSDAWTRQFVAAVNFTGYRQIFALMPSTPDVPP